jgi:hypothetical protein
LKLNLVFVLCQWFETHSIFCIALWCFTKPYQIIVGPEATTENDGIGYVLPFHAACGSGSIRSPPLALYSPSRWDSLPYIGCFSIQHRADPIACCFNGDPFCSIFVPIMSPLNWPYLHFLSCLLGRFLQQPTMSYAGPHTSHIYSPLLSSIIVLITNQWLHNGRW